MPKDEPNWNTLLGIGSQVLVGVAMGLGIGLWLDKRYGWSPWGVIIGTLVGLAAGMYSMIHEAMKVFRDPPDGKSSGSKK